MVFKLTAVHVMPGVWYPGQASGSHVDLIRGPYALYGVKYIDLGSL